MKVKTSEFSLLETEYIDRTVFRSD